MALAQPMAAVWAEDVLRHGTAVLVHHLIQAVVAAVVALTLLQLVLAPQPGELQQEAARRPGQRTAVVTPVHLYRLATEPDDTMLPPPEVIIQLLLLAHILLPLPLALQRPPQHPVGLKALRLPELSMRQLQAVLEIAAVV